MRRFYLAPLLVVSALAPAADAAAPKLPSTAAAAQQVEKAGERKFLSDDNTDGYVRAECVRDETRRGVTPYRCDVSWSFDGTGRANEVGAGASYKANAKVGKRWKVTFY